MHKYLSLLALHSMLYYFNSKTLIINYICYYFLYYNIIIVIIKIKIKTFVHQSCGATSKTTKQATFAVY